jgi:Mn-containing catalase
VTAEDWETKYREAWEKFKLERELTLQLKDKMSFQQERYIMHEQEYRKTIEQIKKDIDTNSTKPLQIIQEYDENALLLMGIDPAAPPDDKHKTLKPSNTAASEAPVNQKTVKVIHQTYEDLQRSIGTVQQQTANVLMKQREEIWTTLDRKLDDIKQQLKAEHDKKQEDNYDFKEREKELNEHLDTMTQIA